MGSWTPHLWCKCLRFLNTSFSWMATFLLLIITQAQASRYFKCMLKTGAAVFVFYVYLFQPEYNGITSDLYIDVCWVSKSNLTYTASACFLVALFTCDKTIVCVSSIEFLDTYIFSVWVSKVFEFFFELSINIFLLETSVK